MIGDGSFLQTGTELAAAAMLGLPLVVVVLNNGGWEAIKDLQINLFGAARKATTNWTTPDGKAVLRGCDQLRAVTGLHVPNVSRIQRNSQTPSSVLSRLRAQSCWR